MVFPMVSNRPAAENNGASLASINRIGILHIRLRRAA